MAKDNPHVNLDVYRMKKFDINPFAPCEEAVEFYARFLTFEEAWAACPRGDWMLWIASKLGVEKRLIVLAKARCAETILHLMVDERSRKAVEIAIRYGEGKATEEELRAAATAADAVSYAAYAAIAAADASYDADAAADAIADAIADAAAGRDSAAAAKKANQNQTAEICRQILTAAVLERIGKILITEIQGE